MLCKAKIGNNYPLPFTQKSPFSIWAPVVVVRTAQVFTTLSISYLTEPFCILPGKGKEDGTD